MKKEARFTLRKKNTFKEKLLCWSKKKSMVCFLDSNLDSLEITKSQEKYYHYDLIAGVGCKEEMKGNSDSFSNLKRFHKKHKNWIFGYFTYDVKNEIEKLNSKNPDDLEFPECHFFVPEIVFLIERNEVILLYESPMNLKKIEKIKNEIENTPVTFSNHHKITLEQRVSKEHYLENIKKIKKHIQLGDIYELNYCIEFFAKNKNLNPISTFEKLNKLTASPFACFYKIGGQYLMCGSPERFLKKTGNTIISQPIKGTQRRGKNNLEDNILEKKLTQSQKEKSENVMITDLVRNDLSRTAEKNSVIVEELLGLYKFKQVFQLISTVKSRLSKKHYLTDAIKFAFPMGSMTGAPKIKSMELIEKYENHKRGLFSGSVGYISPTGDFDFNVIIRSILYNEIKKYISVSVGSAITINSDEKSEYKECQVKANAMFKALGAHVK